MSTEPNCGDLAICSLGGTAWTGICIAAVLLCGIGCHSQGTPKQESSVANDNIDSRSIEFARALVATEKPRVSAQADSFLSTVMLEFRDSRFCVFVHRREGEWSSLSIKHSGIRSSVFGESRGDKNLIKLFVDQYDLDDVLKSVANEAEMAAIAFTEKHRTGGTTARQHAP